MIKLIQWTSAGFLSACLVLSVAGCGFFGDSKDEASTDEVASASTKKTQTSSKPVDMNQTSAETSQASSASANPFSSGSAAKKQPPSRGPVIASSGSMGSSKSGSKKNASSKGNSKGSRTRGPTMASGGFGGAESGNAGVAPGLSEEGGDSSDGGGNANGGQNPFANGNSRNSGGGGESGFNRRDFNGGPPDDMENESDYNAELDQDDFNGGPPEDMDQDPNYEAEFSQSNSDGGTPEDMDQDPGNRGENGFGGPARGNRGGDAAGNQRPPAANGDNSGGSFLDGVRGFLGGLGGANNSDSESAAADAGRPSSKNAGLMAKAQQAMAEGRENDAFAYLYALALTEDRSKLFDEVRWVSGMKRPALAVRWAIGVDAKISPKSYKGSLYPIGSTQNLPSRERGGGAGGGFPGYGDPGGQGGQGGLGEPNFGGGGAANANANQEKQLADFAGELGPGVVAAMIQRVENGSFGDLLKGFSKVVTTTGAGSGRGPTGFGAGAGGDSGRSRGPTGFGAGAGGPPGRGAGEDLGAGDDEESMLAPPNIQGSNPDDPQSGRQDPGDPQGAFNRNGGGRPGQANNRGGNAKPPVNRTGPPQLAAGVIYLGENNATTLRRKAEENGVDLLMIFHVSVSKARSGIVKTTTKITVTDVNKGTAVIRSKTLTNTKVQLDRKDNETPVAEWVDEVVDQIDDSAEGLIVSEIPQTLKPEHAKARVDRLAGEHYSNPLPVLNEIAFWYSRNLIDDEMRTLAYQQILGKLAGEQLSLGNAAERLEVLKRWLPKD